MAIERFYISCTKKTPTTTLSDSNRPVKSYTESTIYGYKGSQTDKLVTIAGKQTIETFYKFFTSDFDITSMDLIVYDDEIYEIVGDPKNTANRNHHIKVLIRKVENIKQ